MAKLDTLQNKVVWITGASSGLGKALAGELALQGAKLILTSRRFEELEEVRWFIKPRSSFVCGCRYY